MALGLKKKKPGKTVATKRKLSASNGAPVDARRMAFVEHYVLLKNATQAAIKAGYSKKTAHVQGSRLLRDAVLGPAIKARMAEVLTKLEISAERTMQEIARRAYVSVEKFIKIDANGHPVIDFSKATSDDLAGLDTVSVEEFMDGRSDKREVRRVKFALGDKDANLALLARHFGLAKEVVQHNHSHDLSLMGLLLEELDDEFRAANAKVVEGVK